jgi:lipoprotein-anchoring transpeptidase ErfK/SrfK
MSSVAVTISQAQQPAPPPTTQPAVRDPALASLTKALPMLDDKARRGLALQVGLDRAGFSPGEIDAAPGQNTDRAMAALKAARGSTDLGEAYANPVVSYTITPEDAAGPFIETVPDDMMEMAKLPALTYTSVLEMLAERFHSSPKLLQRLNPTASFSAGEAIVVPNVEPFVIANVKDAAAGKAAAEKGTTEKGATEKGAAAQKAPAEKSAAAKPAGATPDAVKADSRDAAGELTVTITDRTKTLEVKNAAGELVFHAPVTTGSENDPLPVGEWKVNGVGRNPVFNYNPKLFWDADPTHAKAKVPAGPNNPVGVVWIDLSKEHYGIHGTPEPSRIGYTESHGCIRLTNWDAVRLAAMVGPGTKVILR